MYVCFEGALTEPDHGDDPMEDIHERLNANTYQQEQLRSSLKVKDVHGNANANEKAKELENSAPPSTTSGTISRNSSNVDLNKLDNASSSSDIDGAYSEFPEENASYTGLNRMNKPLNQYTEVQVTTRPRSNSNASEKASEMGEGSVLGDVEMGT